MSLLTKALGRLAMIAGAGLLLYLAFMMVYGTVSTVTASGNADPDTANPNHKATTPAPAVRPGGNPWRYAVYAR